METLRPTDFLGRMGGEEFAVLLPETSATEAYVAAERLRHMIQSHAFALPAGDPIKVTASFGLSSIENSADVGEWFASADKELYRAKAEGRNCTRMMSFDIANCA
jgi:diguanylate cyclase (GGDEF)-like protein